MPTTTPLKGDQLVMTKIEVDLHSLILGKAKIIELWDLGIWNDLAFVYAAVCYEEKNNQGDLFTIDIENFIFNWSGIPDPDTGKVKRLTKKRLLNCLTTLEEKGEFRLQQSQLSLNFGAEP